MHVRGAKCHLPLRQHGVRRGWGPGLRRAELERGAVPGPGQRLALHPGGRAAGGPAAASGATLALHQQLPHPKGATELGALRAKEEEGVKIQISRSRFLGMRQS